MDSLLKVPEAEIKILRGLNSVSGAQGFSLSLMNLCMITLEIFSILFFISY